MRQKACVDGDWRSAGGTRPSAAAELLFLPRRRLWSWFQAAHTHSRLHAQPSPAVTFSHTATPVCLVHPRRNFQLLQVTFQHKPNHLTALGLFVCYWGFFFDDVFVHTCSSCKKVMMQNAASPSERAELNVSSINGAEMKERSGQGIRSDRRWCQNSHKDFWGIKGKCNS